MEEKSKKSYTKHRFFYGIFFVIIIYITVVGVIFWVGSGAALTTNIWWWITQLHILVFVACFVDYIQYVERSRIKAKREFLSLIIQGDDNDSGEIYGYGLMFFFLDLTNNRKAKIIRISLASVLLPAAIYFTVMFFYLTYLSMSLASALAFFNAGGEPVFAAAVVLIFFLFIALVLLFSSVVYIVRIVLDAISLHKDKARAAEKRAQEWRHEMIVQQSNERFLVMERQSTQQTQEKAKIDFISKEFDRLDERVTVAEQKQDKEQIIYAIVLFYEQIREALKIRDANHIYEIEKMLDDVKDYIQSDPEIEYRVKQMARLDFSFRA